MLRFQLLILILISAFGVRLCADEGHHHALTAEEIGSVHFATSCAPQVETDFNRAVALLHSFQYEQSRGMFEDIARRDPTCAMAQWGVAMTHFHGLWKNSTYDAGRAANVKAQEIAAANPRTTTREKGYIDALSEVYRQDGNSEQAHAKAYEQKMAKLRVDNPQDSEAAIFYALALAITAPKTDKTFSNQQKCGEILGPIFQQQPHHPGVAHYLIHCYDNPALAEKGLPAARAYAKIAPASAHAQHMPSHIFTRVGSWDEAIESNLNAKLSATEAEKTSTGGEARDQRLHAMDYLEYAYLQSGQDSKAKAIRDELELLNSIAGLTLTGNYATEAIPARYAIERRDWKEAASLKPDATAVPSAQALTWQAVGEGAARSGDLAHAREAGQALAQLRDKANELKNTYWAAQIEVQRREVEAWIAQAAGDREAAMTGMRSAAELEESMDKDPITPGPITPAREMLAELLATNGQPAKALAEYEAVLRVAPKRFNAVYGAATAAQSAGDEAKGAEYYRSLNDFVRSDERPEAVAAKKKLEMAKK